MSIPSPSVNIIGTMSLDATGTATLRLSRLAPATEQGSASTSEPKLKGLDLFSIGTPPTSDFILEGMKNNSFDIHASRVNMTARQVYVMIYNIQGRLGLTKGLDGGWSETASKMILEMLGKAKKSRTTSRATSSIQDGISEEDASSVNMDSGHEPNQPTNPEMSGNDSESHSSGSDDDNQSNQTSSSYTASTPSPVDLMRRESDWHDTYVCALDMARPINLHSDKREKQIVNRVSKTIKKAKGKCFTNVVYRPFFRV